MVRPSARMRRHTSSPSIFGSPRSRSDEVGVLLRAVEGGRAVLAHVDLVALPPQRTGQRLGDGCVVLGEEHSGHVTVLKICRSEGAPAVVSLSTSAPNAP